MQTAGPSSLESCSMRHLWNNKSAGLSKVMRAWDSIGDRGAQGNVEKSWSPESRYVCSSVETWGGREVLRIKPFSAGPLETLGSKNQWHI